MNPWQSFFKNTPPWMKQMNHMNLTSPEDIDKYIQQCFQSMFNQQNPIQEKQSHSTGEPNSDRTPQSTEQENIHLFESFDFIFVHVPVSNEEWTAGVKISHSSTKLFIHYSHQDTPIHLTLPSLVKQRNTTAKYRKGLVEIRLEKANDNNRTEISIE